MNRCSEGLVVFATEAGEEMTGKLKQERVFYSWQADLPAKDHRYFIETALRKAIETINKDESSVHELILDRDTKNVAGAPVIAETILGKVDQSTAFVADVTIVGRLPSGKAVINSNVSIELGYALRAIPESGLIWVVNVAYGPVEDLPFDLKHRRLMKYELSPTASAEDRKRVAKELQDDLTKALRLLVSETQKAEVEPVEELEEYLLDPTAGRRAARLIETEVERLVGPVNAIAVSDVAKDVSPEGTYRLMQTYEKLSGDVVALYVRGGYDDDSSLTKALVSGLNQISHVTPVPHRYGGNPHLYPALLCLYAGGIAAVAGDRYETLVSLMRDVKIKTSETQGSLPAAFQLVPYRVIHERIAKELPPVRARHFPMSDYLFEFLREPLKRVIKVESQYEESFLRFEYLFAIASAIANGRYGVGVYAPVGSYMWERNLRKEPYIYEVTDEELRKEKEEWPPFKAGIFEGTFEEFLELKREADENMKKTTARIRL